MDIFAKLKTAIKLREVHIDSEIFQLHYRVTSLLLLGSAALVASKQHFGDPIDCISNDDLGNVLDTYCWIHSTFILPRACNQTIGVDGVAHPCVDKFSSKNDEKRHQKYYQWVYFVLFFQAACFYAPHFFWKIKEGKLLENLTRDLNNPLLKKERKKEAVSLLVKYVARHRGLHQYYFLYYILCEIINFCNVILQIYIVDAFLGGTFTTYGLDVINYMSMDQDERFDPMVRVFPRLTKCTFHKYGASGDVQRHDSLCILPLNIINEKIYVFMWFWFVFLAFVSGCWLIYRALTYFNPEYRVFILSKRANHSKRSDIAEVLNSENSGEGDWFLLNMMAKNMDNAVYRKFILSLLRRVKLEKMKRSEHKKQSKYPPFEDDETDYQDQDEEDDSYDDDASPNGKLPQVVTK